MSFRNYLDSRSNLVVRHSEVESRASGLSVGRIEVWPPRSARGSEVASLIEQSRHDVVILRSGAEDVELAAALNTETLVSWQADTLLYFTSSAESLAAASPHDALVPLSSSERSVADALVERIFIGYKNHYSTNPVLSKIDVVGAYQDWTRTALARKGGLVFMALSKSGVPTGLCVTDVNDESYDEILLAGIVPEERGQGSYAHMIKAVAARALAAKKELVVISTQASNVRVMRAWCRIGFLPAITLNTIHVVRRDIHRATVCDK